MLLRTVRVFPVNYFFVKFVCSTFSKHYKALASSHDCHALAIDTAEDTLKQNSDSHRIQLVARLAEEELTRSRRRYKEIAHLLDHYRDELFSTEE